MGRLRGQCVELLGHTEVLHLVAFHLPLANHMYQLDADEVALRRLRLGLYTEYV
jgi:hypothetical protein